MIFKVFSLREIEPEEFKFPRTKQELLALWAKNKYVSENSRGSKEKSEGSSFVKME